MTARPRSMTAGALSLMTATVVTNVLGLVFWAAAARIEPARVVGRAAAEIAALTLLATIAQLNFNNIFVRFLPNAGDASARFVWRGYLAVVAAAVATGSLFVGTGLSSGMTISGGVADVLFVVAVVLLAVFALQDSVLTALRRTHWVPIENGSFSIAKLALIPALVMVPTGARLVSAWVAPVAVAVVVVSVLLATRVLPPLRQAGPGTLPAPRRLLSLLGGEYATNLCATATVQLMPVLVVNRLGAASTAWFTLPWLACMGISVLMWNVATPFVVEAVSTGEWAAAAHRVVTLLGAIAATALVGCSLAGPAVLRVAGPGYADHGTLLLLLIGCSAPFTAVTVLYGAFAWLDQRVWRLAAIQAASGSLLIVTALLLLPRVGVAGVGWANLIAQAASAVLMAPAVWSRLSRARLASPSPLEPVA